MPSDFFPAKDSSSSLKETSALLEKSQTALGKFYKQFSNGLTGGEVFLDEVSSSASKSLNKFEIKADKANLAVGDSLDTITRINEKNAKLLKDLEKLNQNLGKDTQLSASVGQKISQLQTQSISAQKLVFALFNEFTSFCAEMLCVCSCEIFCPTDADNCVSFPRF